MHFTIIVIVDNFANSYECVRARACHCDSVHDVCERVHVGDSARQPEAG